MPYSPANKEAMMKNENLMNMWYREPEDGKFEDATKEILEAVSGDSNTDYDEEMEPVAAIPAHLADNFHNFNDIYGFFLERWSLLARTIISDFSKFAKIR